MIRRIALILNFVVMVFAMKVISVVFHKFQNPLYPFYNYISFLEKETLGQKEDSEFEK